MQDVSVIFMSQTQNTLKYIFLFKKKIKEIKKKMFKMCIHHFSWKYY